MSIFDFLTGELLPTLMQKSPSTQREVGFVLLLKPNDLQGAAEQWSICFCKYLPCVTSQGAELFYL